MKSVAITDAADADLEGIYRHLAEKLHVPDTAARFRRQVAVTCQQISLQPGIGWPRRFRHPELKGLRSWRVEKFRSYLVFYRERDQDVQIVRVLWGGMDLPRALRRPSG